MELRLTFETKSDATPRTLPFPPRWLDYTVNLDDEDEDEKSTDPAVIAITEWDKVPFKDQTAEAWRGLQPDDERLDQAWAGMVRHLSEDLHVVSWLPKELRGILDTLIEKGPHRVTAPACMLEALGRLIELEAEQASDYDKEYELSVLRALLMGDAFE